MSGREKQKEEFQRWPKYRDMYAKAFEKMIAARKENGLPCDWETSEEVFDWWLSKKAN